MNIELTPEMLTAIPLVTFILQWFKTFPGAGRLAPWQPLLAVVVSIGMAFLMKMGANPQETIWSGIVLGMASSGLYSSAKAPGAVAAAREAAIEREIARTTRSNLPETPQDYLIPQGPVTPPAEPKP